MVRQHARGQRETVDRNRHPLLAGPRNPASGSGGLEHGLRTAPEFGISPEFKTKFTVMCVSTSTAWPFKQSGSIAPLLHGLARSLRQNRIPAQGLQLAHAAVRSDDRLQLDGAGEMQILAGDRIIRLHPMDEPRFHHAPANRQRACSGCGRGEEFRWASQWRKSLRESAAASLFFQGPSLGIGSPDNGSRRARGRQRDERGCVTAFAGVRSRWGCCEVPPRSSEVP